MKRFLARRHGSRSDPRLLVFPASATLFDTKHPCRGFYLLRAGRVQLAWQSDAIIEFLERGSFFGEVCLTRGSHYQVAKAMSPVQVAVYRKSDLLEAMRRDPHFASQVLKGLARRFGNYAQTVRDFITEDAEFRLARALFRLLPAPSRSGWVRLPWSPSNGELGRTIGTTRWRVSHLLNRFQRAGWLRREDGIWIRREGLRNFLQA